MISAYLRWAFILIGTVSAALFLFNLLLVKLVLPEVYGSGAWWAIYLFLPAVTILTLVVISNRYKVDKTSVLKTYFVFVFVKMFGSIGFLIPWLVWKTPFSQPFAYQFLVCFFVLLFVEIFALAVLLSGKFDENPKKV